MDRRFKLSLLGAAVFAAAQFSGAAMTGASAADLLPPPAIVEAPEIVQKSNTGWYLRGDISYDFQEVKGYNYTQFGTPAATNTFRTFDLEDAANLGFGLGYQVTNNFRVDLTGDYVFKAHMNGSTCNTTGPTGCGTNLLNPGANFGPYSDTTDVSRLDVMMNAYADLGTFGSITPYVGAGIGGSHVKYGTLTNTNVPAGGNVSDTHNGLDSWRFAYALHAGAAYSISSNLKLDVGYTYKHIEGGPSHADGNTFPTGITAPLIYDDGFESHTIRAGLRYAIGGGGHH